MNTLSESIGQDFYLIDCDNYSIQRLGQQDDYHNYMYEAYQMSKNGLNALTREQQRLIDADNRNVLIGSVNPGDVNTDMNKGGIKKPDEGYMTA